MQACHGPRVAPASTPQNSGPVWGFHDSWTAPQRNILDWRAQGTPPPALRPGLPMHRVGSIVGSVDADGVDGRRYRVVEPVLLCERVNVPCSTGPCCFDLGLHLHSARSRAPGVEVLGCSICWAMAACAACAWRIVVLLCRGSRDAQVVLQCNQRAALPLGHLPTLPIPPAHIPVVPGCQALSRDGCNSQRPDAERLGGGGGGEGAGGGQCCRPHVWLDLQAARDGDRLR